MRNFLWTRDRVEKVNELYKHGDPYRIIAEKIGCSKRELEYQMRDNKVCRQPLTNAKLSEIQFNFFQSKRQNTPTPIRL